MYVYKAKLDRVVDGDTVDANIDLGFDISINKRIRLAGIDTPETRTRNKEEKIKGLEKATHQKNYKEKDLLNLYKRFQFNINQLINAQDSYQLLPSYKGRALLYQKLLL